MNRPPEEDSLDILLDYVKRVRGYDFSGYKKASLERRIRRRLTEEKIETFGAYIDHLEVHPDEFARLFNTVLINVTSFFRDRPAWSLLESTVIPQMMARKSPDDPIRIWSAGCATGEEAYTLASILVRTLGERTFREQVKIYASDIDEAALSKARSGSYTERECEGLPEEYLQDCFERSGDRLVFRQDLRRSIIFGRHNVIQDAPISRLDLLTCRNLLIYFNAETQSRVLNRFHFSLNEHGHLMLGRAETLLSQGRLFVPIDLKLRIFVPVPDPGGRDPILPLGSPVRQEPRTLAHAVADDLGDAAFERNLNAQVVVGRDGSLLMCNERAREYFKLSPSDVGRPFQDVELSYRPTELRSLVMQAFEKGRPVAHSGVEWRTSPTETRWIDVHLVPLFDASQVPMAVCISFEDVTETRSLRHQLEISSHDLEAAYQELQSTVEELETTNEELQSTVEELETTNEELQSTNEELETMNEELQSSNDELASMNVEFLTRGGQLNEANEFLQSILTSIPDGVIVVDKDLCVMAWNRRAVDLWGLHAEEVMGRSLLDLDIGLSMEPLQPALRAVLAGMSPSEELRLPAINRRGRTIECRVMLTERLDSRSEVHGVILMMQEIAQPA